ncbi:hypothetical protein N0V87_008792 [Didymella glomerata]|uniref:Uncharacterized protein n=1 Tax=Didymella glomerata TaxID=749621 RepID=A0A9W8WSY0_9PLEO|nr:hypothetical protein N0V87_008792 [Didymella glomerata]
MYDRAADRKSTAFRTASPPETPSLPSKILPSIVYFALLATVLYYSLSEGHSPGGQPWQLQSDTFVFLSIFQLVYVWALWSSNALYAIAAARVSTHFVVSSVLTSAFVHLWVRSHFWPAELLLLASFFNLSLAYFRHSNTPLPMHIAALAGPLAWNFAALYCVGATAIRSTHLVARIAAHLSICGWLAYGVFYLATYKDFVVGFALSVLSISTGVAQLPDDLAELSLQPIFAFTVAGLLFAVSFGVAFPGLLSHEPFPRGRIVSDDRERAPLLPCGE